MNEDIEQLKRKRLELGESYSQAMDLNYQLLARAELLQAELSRLKDGIAKIEARWRTVSLDKVFRSHYRDTMAECANELEALLVGFDDNEVQIEIEKAFEAGEL